MIKKPSYLWVLGIGVFFPVLALLIATFGGGGQGSTSSPVDYALMFLAGALIGTGVVYLLRKCTTPGAFRTVVIFFLVSVPLALFGMIVGGSVGGIGLILLSVSPVLFLAGMGYLFGRLFFKQRT
ncbi:MAG: hypothetical protein FJZ87_16830 [Chloroflexi bacterium]|nr:hypothetical protein [Chloroflexota bacterium]